MALVLMLKFGFIEGGMSLLLIFFYKNSIICDILKKILTKCIELVGNCGLVEQTGIVSDQGSNFLQLFVQKLGASKEQRHININNLKITHYL